MTFKTRFKDGMWQVYCGVSGYIMGRFHTFAEANDLCIRRNMAS